MGEERDKGSLLGEGESYGRFLAFANLHKAAGMPSVGKGIGDSGTTVLLGGYGRHSVFPRLQVFETESALRTWLLPPKGPLRLHLDMI